MPSTNSRRSFLLALGAAATLAGCTTTADEPPTAGAGDDPDPDRHVFGATGEWSSFGCNAANTRQVDDGQAPTDGVEERWRAEVNQLTRTEPLVADGRVYQVVYGTGLRVYDADDGSVLWTEPDADGVPLVANEKVYVAAGGRLRALDPETGDGIWERRLPGSRQPGTPATYAGEWLAVPAGETLHRVDPETGEIAWSRRLFGRIAGPPAIYVGYGITVATEAGKLYVLGQDGDGYGEWSLPATPQSPPTAGSDGVYVNCRDGRTYGVTLEDEPRHDVDWRVETGWNDAGLAVAGRLYAAGPGGLHAIDLDSGERTWRYDVGDSRWSAPALGRDTLFVGGERLHALDPTPSSGLFGSPPATRWTRSFHGRVGPGPVLDDGRLYVVAETGESRFHLLALE